MNLNQLVTATGAARLKGWRLETFLYHIKKEEAPKPVKIDGIRFWDKGELTKWQPSQNHLGRHLRLK